MLPAPTFTAETHEYYAGKRWLPGITRVLSDMGYSKGSDFFTDESRWRGQALHYACQLIDEYAPEATTLEDVLEIVNIDERIRLGVSGYLWFKREKGFRVQHQELPSQSKRLKLAGKWDKWGTYADGRRVMVDLKSWRSQGAKPKRSAELQTAGYVIMAKETYDLDTDLRVVLKLPGDGTFREYVCENPTDELVLASCCHVWWDRAAYGLVEAKGASEIEMAA